MICFGVKKGPRSERKGTCRSHFKIKFKKNKNQIKEKEKDGRGRDNREVSFLFFIIFIFFSHFSLRYTEIGQSEFVGARSKVLYSMRATHWNQKHGISSSFYLKFGKSSVLVFLRSTAFCLLELVGAEGQINPRIASYA